MHNILVVGSNGQIGSHICKSFVKNNIKFKTTNKKNKVSFISFLKKYYFSIIINCAGFTDLENSIKNKKKCTDINFILVKTLVDHCKKNKIILIHFSSDYVFNGKKQSPYSERSRPSPINFYGKSKLKADIYIMKNLSKYIILRVSSVYSSCKNNFLYKIYKSIKKNKIINIVSNQYSAPTYVQTICINLNGIISKIKKNKSILWGLYNLNDNEILSWYEFAIRIINNMKPAIDKVLIRPINLNDLNSNIERPRYTGLSIKKFKKNFTYYKLKLDDNVREAIKHYEQ
jgi:dTDP-4-dehydrorhamnose reductase